MDVEVETTMEIESLRLPVFLLIIVSMVEIEEELTSIADHQKSCEVCLSTGEETSQITVLMDIALVFKDL